MMPSIAQRVAGAAVHTCGELNESRMQDSLPTKGHFQ